jgi:hypothetical protein
METYLKFKITQRKEEFNRTHLFSDFLVDVDVNIMKGKFGRENLRFPDLYAECDFQKGDKIYFAPGVNIPRVKMKNIYNEFGVRSVRDIDQADKVFVGAKTIDEMSTSYWYYTVKTEAFKKFIDSLTVGTHIDGYDSQKITDSLEHYTNEYVLIDSWSEIRLLKDFPCIPGHIEPADVISSDSFYYFTADGAKLYEELITKPLYHEDSLLKYINGTDAVVIDEQMFGTLCDMFSSGDTDNTVLAMEIMANSNYLESLVYLLFLFEDHGHKISDQRSRNHVNFKGLTSYLNIHAGSITQDMVCKILIEKGAVTKENMNLVLKRFHDSLPDYYTYFKPIAITFNSEISEMLNEQLVIPLQEFTPAEVEEEVIEEVTESEFAVEDNIEDFSEENLDEPVLEIIEEIKLPEEDLQELKQEVESNNHQTKQDEQPDIDWF